MHAKLYPGNPSWDAQYSGIYVPPQCWDFRGYPGNLGILSIQESIGLHSAGTSQDVPGIPGYLVFRDLCASTELGIPGMSRESWDTQYSGIYVPPQCWDFPGCPGNPGILSIQGSMGLYSAGNSWDVPGILGYLVFRDLWASTVLGIPRMSLGIPGYLVSRNLWASIVLRFSGVSRESWDTQYSRIYWPSHCWDFPGCPGNPGIFSIQGYLGLHSAGTSHMSQNPMILSIPGSMDLHSAGTFQDVQGILRYLVFRDLCAFMVLGLPRMSREPQDTQHSGIYGSSWCWDFPGCPRNSITLSISGSVGLHGAGTSQESQDTQYSAIYGHPQCWNFLGSPTMLSIEGSLGLQIPKTSGTFR